VVVGPACNFLLKVMGDQVSTFGVKECQVEECSYLSFSCECDSSVYVLINVTVHSDDPSSG
jgi:hypothetical protein